MTQTSTFVLEETPPSLEIGRQTLIKLVLRIELNCCPVPLCGSLELGHLSLKCPDLGLSRWNFIDVEIGAFFELRHRVGLIRGSSRACSRSNSPMS